MRTDGTPTLWWDVRSSTDDPLVSEAIERAVRVDATEAWRAVWNIKGLQTLSDIPCWRPPWPVAWVECDIDGGGASFGAIVIDGRTVIFDERMNVVELPEERGSFAAIMFVRGKYPWRSQGAVAARYRDDGAFVGEDYTLAPAKPNDRGRTVRVDDETQDQWCVGVDAFAAEMMPTIGMLFSMCSCKNVVVDRTTRVEGSRRARKEFGASGGGVVWSRIVIEQPTARGARIDGAGATRTYRAHFVRGHFAEYTEDRPLFGRYVGRFWVPLHRRGDEKAGRVLQEYAVRGSPPGASSGPAGG